MMTNRKLRNGSARRQRGSALIEYTVIAFVLVAVLISQGNVVAQLMQAIKDLYEAFSYAISMTFP